MRAPFCVSSLVAPAENPPLSLKVPRLAEPGKGLGQFFGKNRSKNPQNPENPLSPTKFVRVCGQRAPEQRANLTIRLRVRPGFPRQDQIMLLGSKLQQAISQGRPQMRDFTLFAFYVIFSIVTFMVSAWSLPRSGLSLCALR